MTAQLPAPITIAEADTAAAKRNLVAIVKLILDPAMVGAVRTTAVPVDHAVITKPRRQRQRPLPICLDDW